MKPNQIKIPAGRLWTVAAMLFLGISAWAQEPVPSIAAAGVSPRDSRTGQAVQFVARTDRPAAIVLLQFPDVSSEHAIRMQPDSSFTTWSYQMVMTKPVSLRFAMMAFNRAGRSGRTASGTLRV
jgi:hypothetical protein